MTFPATTPATGPTQPMLDVRAMKKVYDDGNRTVEAVRNLTFSWDWSLGTLLAVAAAMLAAAYGAGRHRMVG